MPAYRPPVAVPWSDEPQVAQWARPDNRTKPLTGQSWPLIQRARGIALTPLLLLGFILFAICVFVGFFLPYVLPFH